MHCREFHRNAPIYRERDIFVKHRPVLRRSILGKEEILRGDGSDLDTLTKLMDLVTRPAVDRASQVLDHESVMLDDRV